MSTLNVSNISDGTTTVGTSYVVNGSAKAWVNFNGTGTIATRDSFNVASLTDNATGDSTINFTANMGNSNYNATTIPRINASIKGTVATFHAALNIRVQSRAGSVSGTLTDSDYNCYTIHGDLA